MKSEYYRIIPVLFYTVLAIFAIFNPIAAGEVIRKQDFTISIPNDWMEIPKTTLDVCSRKLSEASKEDVVDYDYGFQIKTTNRTKINFPYLLIKEINTGRIPESQLADMAASMETEFNNKKDNPVVFDYKSGKKK